MQTKEFQKCESIKQEVCTKNKTLQRCDSHLDMWIGQRDIEIRLPAGVITGSIQLSPFSSQLWIIFPD